MRGPEGGGILAGNTHRDEARRPMTDEKEKHTSSTAFILWLACLLGACGIHRFYLGKPVTGILYLLTFGLLGVGQVIDLFKMSGMVEEANQRSRLAAANTPKLLAAPTIPPEEVMRMKLLAVAKENGGQVSVSQGVMATGKTFKEVEQALDAMAVSGYVDIGNDPETGAVVYIFSGIG